MDRKSRSRRNKIMKIKKGLISSILVAAIAIYCVACYGEALIKNANPNPQYSSWNIFATMVLNEE